MGDCGQWLRAHNVQMWLNQAKICLCGQLADDLLTTCGMRSLEGKDPSNALEIATCPEACKQALDKVKVGNA